MKIFLLFGVCLFGIGQVISGPLAEIDFQYSSRAIESKVNIKISSKKIIKFSIFKKNLIIFIQYK